MPLCHVELLINKVGSNLVGIKFRIKQGSTDLFGFGNNWESVVWWLPVTRSTDFSYSSPIYHESSRRESGTLPVQTLDRLSVASMTPKYKGVFCSLWVSTIPYLDWSSAIAKGLASLMIEGTTHEIVPSVATGAECHSFVKISPWSVRVSEHVNQVRSSIIKSIEIESLIEKKSRSQRK